MKQAESNHIRLITKKLDEACLIEFGTRVVQKKDGGAIYSVYGGGDATFKMDKHNRENCLVVSRFAMSKKCTRFVSGKFYLNDSGLTVKPKNINELRQEYLDYLLLALNDTIYSLSRGTAQRNLNVSKFRNIEIQYPDSIDAQLHIAEILSKAENLIVQRKESIRLLDEFLKSTFLEMFGNPVRNEKKWVTNSFPEFGSLKNGLNYTRLESGVTIHCLGVGDFKDVSKLTDIESLQILNLSTEPSDDYLLKNEDLVFVRSNGSRELVGRCLLVYPNSEKVTFSGFCIRYRIEKSGLNPIFLSHLFRDQIFRTSMLLRGKGANIQNISQQTLERLKIPIPPIELQTQFANIVEKAEALKAQYQQSLRELENLYGSLSQRAFRGELGTSEEKPTVAVS